MEAIPSYNDLQKKMMSMENDLHWCRGDLAVSVKECGRLEKVVEEQDCIIREMELKIKYLDEQLNKANIKEEILRGFIKDMGIR